jgi:hypothetical protein
MPCAAAALNTGKMVGRGDPRLGRLAANWPWSDPPTPRASGAGGRSTAGKQQPKRRTVDVRIAEMPENAGGGPRGDVECVAVWPAVEEWRDVVIGIDSREADEIHRVAAEGVPVAPMDEQVPRDPPGWVCWVLADERSNALSEDRQRLECL